MRRTIAATVATLAIAIPPLGAIAAPSRTADRKTPQKKVVVVKKVSGPAVAADRWGEVKVVLSVRKTTTVTNGRTKTTRRWFDISGSFTYHSDRTRFIMEQALPILRAQAIARHSADVDIISGATYTSEAFAESLQAAILKAAKV